MIEANPNNQGKTMAIQVFHGKDFRAMTDERFGGPALNFPDDFHHVATVDIADEDKHMVFEATNSIDQGWWKNKGVTAHFHSPAFREHDGVKGTRSTSVGDRIRLSDGRVFRCAPVGWEQVG